MVNYYYGEPTFLEPRERLNQGSLMRSLNLHPECICYTEEKMDALLEVFFDSTLSYWNWNWKWGNIIGNYYSLRNRKQLHFVHPEP